MNSLIIKRVIEEAKYMLDTKETIREIAKVFNVSKSTVHKDLHERLQDIDFNLYQQIDSILKYHIDIRHIRGGESTKKKYKKLAWVNKNMVIYGIIFIDGNRRMILCLQKI